MKKAKPILVLIVKLLVSVGLLGYFLARIHIERFLQTFANAKFSYIAIALLVYLATQVVSAMRWAALARPLGVKTPFKDMARYYLIGMFFNLFAPGTVGGDVSRVYYLVRDENARIKDRSVTMMHATMSVLMDRAIGMIVLVWLGAAGLLLFCGCSPAYTVPAVPVGLKAEPGANIDWPGVNGADSLPQVSLGCPTARGVADCELPEVVAVLWEPAASAGPAMQTARTAIVFKNCFMGLLL